MLEALPSPPLWMGHPLPQRIKHYIQAPSLIWTPKGHNSYYTTRCPYRGAEPALVYCNSLSHSLNSGLRNHPSALSIYQVQSIPDRGSPCFRASLDTTHIISLEILELHRISCHEYFSRAPRVLPNIPPRQLNGV